MYFIEQYALQGNKLVITLRDKAPFIVDVEIPAALYNEEELKRAIEAALEGEGVPGHCPHGQRVIWPPESREASHWPPGMPGLRPAQGCGQLRLRRALNEN